MNIIHSRIVTQLVNEANEAYSADMDDPELSPSQREKSSAILRAARRRFAEDGFEATKLSDVAKDAGVAVGTIYLRYESKGALLGGVLQEVEGSFRDVMSTQEIRSLSFPERFLAIVEAILATAGRHDDLAQLMSLAAFARQVEDPDAETLLTAIQAHIADGIDRAELRDDIDLPMAARMAHGMVEGAMREMMTRPSRDAALAARQIADAYARWLMNP